MRLPTGGTGVRLISSPCYDIRYGFYADMTSIGADWRKENNSMKKWECIVCGFLYDEELGLPEEGIAAGTRWNDIPDDWACPDCGVSKDSFAMVEKVA